MKTVNKNDLTTMLQDLQNKAIQVDERGTVEGVVASVESNVDGFVVYYVVDGFEHETRFGGSWNHGSITKNDREMYFDVAHVGTALIQL